MTQSPSSTDQDRIAASSAWIVPLQQEMARVIVGQKHLLDRLLIALLTNGHVLLEGVPGLAKTLALKTLAGCIAVKLKRLQFTPDMLPADIVGTMIYSPQDGAFRTKHGPIFCNLVLADEINRAPAKVQSALLEAMQERQVTIGDRGAPRCRCTLCGRQNPRLHRRCGAGHPAADGRGA
jgi:MoxR-like ATPase